MTEKNKVLPKLKNAILGQVITRFPPEASGYLHLGHVKALLLNYLYAKEYEGKIILRFDDTNPEKENAVYEQAILADIKTLNLDCDMVTYASDYFDQIIDYATTLINNNLAYVDFSSAEEINQQRDKFLPSQYRDTNVEINLEHFSVMRNGKNLNSCLRAKIDYASKNGCLRDPVIFRSKDMVHPRYDAKYFIYPTYDFACPILDAVQGVTHAMRSVEYKDRDSQYEWFLRALNLKNGSYPIISDYGKLSFSHTVLSKRKLAKLVENGQVDGWSDPRMPTVRGVIRAGIQIEPLVEYIKTQMMSRAIVLLTWDKLYSFNTAYLEKNSNRLYGLSDSTIKIILTGSQVNPAREDLPKSVQLSNHPKNSAAGVREMVVCSSLLADANDFTNARIGDRYTLVGLGNAVVTNVDPMTLNYDKLDRDFKSTTKITWLPDDDTNVQVVVKRFGHLLTKPKLESGDNILNAFNTDSCSQSTWLVEKSVSNYLPGSVFQIMRKDYCYVDQVGDQIVLHIVPS